MMAVERFQKINDVLDMFYGPPEDDEILPISLEPVRVCFWQARTDFGDWQHAWKMDVPRGENGDLIDFAEKKNNHHQCCEKRTAIIGHDKGRIGGCIRNVKKKRRRGNNIFNNNYMKNEALVF